MNRTDPMILVNKNERKEYIRERANCIRMYTRKQLEERVSAVYFALTSRCFSRRALGKGSPGVNSSPQERIKYRWYHISHSGTAVIYVLLRHALKFLHVIRPIAFDAKLSTYSSIGRISLAFGHSLDLLLLLSFFALSSGLLVPIPIALNHLLIESHYQP